MKDAWLRLCVAASRLDQRALRSAPRTVTREQVEVALRQLYAEEHATLLREASELRIRDRAAAGSWRAQLLSADAVCDRAAATPAGRDPSAAPQSPDPMPGPRPEPPLADSQDDATASGRSGSTAGASAPQPPEWESWRHRVRSELATARGDGVCPPIELDACTPWPPNVWGDGAALTLARAARSLADGPESRRVELRALAASGRLDLAAERLEQLERRGWRGEVADEEGFARDLELVRAIVMVGRGKLEDAACCLERALDRSVPQLSRWALSHWIALWRRESREAITRAKDERCAPPTIS